MTAICHEMFDGDRQGMLPMKIFLFQHILSSAS